MQRFSFRSFLCSKASHDFPRTGRQSTISSSPGRKSRATLFTSYQCASLPLLRALCHLHYSFYCNESNWQGKVQFEMNAAATVRMSTTKLSLWNANNLASVTDPTSLPTPYFLWGEKQMRLGNPAAPMHLLFHFLHGSFEFQEGWITTGHCVIH